MFRKLWRWLFQSAPRVSEPTESQGQASEPAESQGIVVKNVPALSEPILLFMELPTFMMLSEQLPTWKFVHVRTFAEFEDALPRGPYAMLIALSPPSESSAAGRAIQAFKSKYPEGLTVYHGTDYRLSVSGPRALACQADVLMVGGVAVHELVFCLGTAILLKRRGGLEPSLDSYTKLLQITCAESPFWKLQELKLPISDVE